MSAVPAGSPLCRDCVFCSPGGMYSLDACVRGERVIGVDPVTGHDVHRWDVNEYAYRQREKRFFGGNCGPKGRHFKPRVKQ